MKLSSAYDLLTLNVSVHEKGGIETALCQFCSALQQAAMAQCSHKDCLQNCHEEMHSYSLPSSIHRPSEQRQSKQGGRAKLGKLNSKWLLIEAHTVIPLGNNRWRKKLFVLLTVYMSIRCAAMVNFISFSIASQQNGPMHFYFQITCSGFHHCLICLVLSVDQNTALDMKRKTMNSQQML